MKRLGDILEAESVQYDDKVVAEVLKKHFPDYRRVLNELQRYSVSGVIDAGILANVQEINMKELVEALRGKDFKKVRQWVVDNIDNDPGIVFRKIYDTLLDDVNDDVFRTNKKHFNSFWLKSENKWLCFRAFHVFRLLIIIQVYFRC